MIRIENFIFILWKFLQMSKLPCKILKISGQQMPQMPPPLVARLILTFRIFEQLPLALKTEFALNNHLVRLCLQESNMFKMNDMQLWFTVFLGKMRYVSRNQAVSCSSSQAELGKSLFSTFRCHRTAERVVWSFLKLKAWSSVMKNALSLTNHPSSSICFHVAENVYSLSIVVRIRINSVNAAHVCTLTQLRTAFRMPRDCKIW